MTTFPSQPAQAGAPMSVADELSYELLRDEWELLLAVGTGPTPADVAARRVGAPEEEVEPRLALLARHGLVQDTPSGYAMVPAVHERQEGMASFLRDLVIRRLELGGDGPRAALVRGSLGTPEQLAALIARADEELLPEVFRIASVPATDESERFTLLFVAASDLKTELDDEDEDLHVGNLVKVLRAAAVQRSSDRTRRSAKLWVADMRIDLRVADQIADMFDEFLSNAPDRDGSGAAAYAIIAAGAEGARCGEMR